MPLDDKNILVTGGCGFFGQNFTRFALKKHNPRSIRVYDNRELAQVEMKRKINDARVRFLVGDVRDKERLSRAMNDVDIVIHAAALKHVPICEYNPMEAVKTNIMGAACVIETALDNGAEKVLAISTDKAVHPVNLYGATKMVAEKLFVQANAYRGEKKTKFSCTRYGNVVGSSGSVIPLFMEQRKSGEITITDSRMTRFWITMEQGIRFVIDSIENMQGGEIFVPKIPSTKIMDLAHSLAPEAKANMIGMRPGEKIHEELLTAEESAHTKEFDKYFVIGSEFPFWGKDNFKDGKALSEGFQYSSDANNEWLDEAQIKEMINNLPEE